MKLICRNAEIFSWHTQQYDASIAYQSRSPIFNLKQISNIYDLVLIYVCHFHHHFQWSLFKFDHYWDTRASIFDPCIQGISLFWFWAHFAFSKGISPAKDYLNPLLNWHSRQIACHVLFDMAERPLENRFTCQKLD